MSKPLMVELEELLAEAFPDADLGEVMGNLGILLGERIGTVQEKLMEDLYNERQRSHGLESQVNRLKLLLEQSLAEAGEVAVGG